MKRLLLLLLVAIMVAGCSASKNDNNNENKDETNNTNEVENNENKGNEDNTENEDNLNAENNAENNDTEENDGLNNEEENQDDLISGNEENEENDETAASKEDLTLQMTKVDEEAGTDMDENNVYQELNRFVEANPEHGEANDLSIYVVNTLHNEQGDHLILLAINRMDEPVKNISFEYTLGTDDGELIFDQEPVLIAEEDFGDIKVDHAMPFTLQVNEDQLEIMNKITDENQHIEFDNVNIEFADEE